MIPSVLLEADMLLTTVNWPISSSEHAIKKDIPIRVNILVINFMVGVEKNVEALQMRDSV